MSDTCPTCGSTVRVRTSVEGSRYEPIELLGALELINTLARSHANNASPELRGRARRILGGGECAEWQACPRRGANCELCGVHGDG